MTMQAEPAAAALDLDRFRLRRFVESLTAIGELQEFPDHVALADLSVAVESTPKAGHFHSVGKDKLEMVSAVSGTRRRIAHAFGVDPRDVAHEQMRRMGVPQPVVEIPSSQAPVHEVVLTGDQIDLSTLPFHLQHELDGAPYISSAIDFTEDPITGRRNVGCRRLMYRDKTTLRANLSQPSDLKKMYLACVDRGERLAASFAIGSHPLDFIAAGMRVPGDECELIAKMRGAALPLVRGVSNGLLVPADVEMIIEGYFDELGYREFEGPYGEFYGFYGPVHMDPVFHVTAITMRKDVLHQTVRHSGSHLSLTESGNLGGINAEAQMWRALRTANIEPTAIYSVPDANGRQHARVSLKRSDAANARLAIAALFSIPRVKLVTVVDDDVDVFDSEMMEWALSARFRADQDVVISNGFPGFYMDPTMDAAKTIAKMGFDCTADDRPMTIERHRPTPPKTGRVKRFASVRDALAEKPLFFYQIMDAMGSDDGREVAEEVNKLYLDGVVTRKTDGEWALV